MSIENRHPSHDLTDFVDPWEVAGSFDEVRGIHNQEFDYVTLLSSNHDPEVEELSNGKFLSSFPSSITQEHVHVNEVETKIKTFSPFIDWNLIVSNVKASLNSSNFYENCYEDELFLDLPKVPCPTVPFNLMPTNFALQIIQKDAKYDEFSFELLRRIHLILKNQFNEFDFSFVPDEWLWRGKFISSTSFCLLDIRVYFYSEKMKSLTPISPNLNINDCPCCSLSGSTSKDSTISSCSCISNKDDEIFSFEDLPCFVQESERAEIKNCSNSNHFVIEANKTSGDSSPFSRLFVGLKEKLTSCGCTSLCRDTISCSKREIDFNIHKELEDKTVMSKCPCLAFNNYKDLSSLEDCSPEKYLENSAPIFEMSTSDFLDCRLEASRMLCDLSMTEDKSLINSVAFIQKVMESIDYLILNNNEGSIESPSIESFQPSFPSLSLPAPLSKSNIDSPEFSSSSPFSSFLLSHFNPPKLPPSVSSVASLSAVLPPPTSSAILAPCLLNSENKDLFQLCLVKEMSLIALSEFSKIPNYHSSIVYSKILPVLMDIAVYAPLSTLTFTIAQVSRECTSILERISTSNPDEFVQILLKSHDYPLPLWLIQAGMIKDAKRALSLSIIIELLTPHLNISIPLH